MKVYKVCAGGRPPGSKFDNYAPLVPGTKRDEKWLGIDEFGGQPFTRKWRALELVISQPLHPKPDFFNFGPGVFVCSQRVVELTDGALGMSGELLPVRVKGENGRYFVFNCTNCIDAIDARRSRWEKLADDIKLLERPAFVGHRVGEIPLFKIPEDGGTGLYCMERTGDPEDLEFKALVEANKLAGLEFTLVWSDRRPDGRGMPKAGRR